jgi:3-hydroxyacyl-[acyl-carrier-protein] dehydratase
VAVTDRVVLDRAGIERVIPHRAPFLLLDAVTALSEDAITAVRQLEPGDPLFAGHFPDQPVLPGVLLLEMMAQALLVLHRHTFPQERLLFIAKIKSKFLEPVRPGAALIVSARRVKFLVDRGIGEAQVLVAGRVVADAWFSFAAPGAPAE